MKTISKVDFSPTALYVSPANNFRTEGQMQNARKPKKWRYLNIFLCFATGFLKILQLSADHYTGLLLCNL